MYAFAPLRYTLETLFIPVACGIVVAVIVATIARVISRRNSFFTVLAYYAGFGVPVGVAAYAAGLLTGLSRQSAIGTVLPAILALIAGLNAYIFGTESRYKVVVGYCVIMLAFMLVLGAETGAFERVRQRGDYLLYLSQQEFRIHNLRKNLDLPGDIPAWLLGEDSK